MARYCTLNHSFLPFCYTAQIVVISHTCICIGPSTARFVFKVVRSLWNLTGTSAALLPMCLSNFKAIRQFKVPISWLRDFTRSGDRRLFGYWDGAQVGVSLHLATSPNEFSWLCKFVDGVSILSDMCDNLCLKLDDGSSSSMRSRHLISNTNMMTSSEGNIFRVPGPLCGEFTGYRWIPRTKASDAKLRCFLWSTPE